jgi:hypothetical protein
MHNKEGSTFQVEEGVLFLTVGILAMTEQAGHLAKAVRFCPFCGTELQSTEAIQSWYATR